MNGTRRGGYTATLAALLVAGAVAFSGAALADAYDDGDGSSQHGSDGKDGTATTHCKQKFSTDVHAPIQCYPSTPKHGKAHGKHGGDDTDGDDTGGDGANGANGTSTSNGASPNNGKSDYKNPVTGETHFIPIPNIG
jgi:hypothetical protein